MSLPAIAYEALLKSFICTSPPPRKRPIAATAAAMVAAGRTEARTAYLVARPCLWRAENKPGTTCGTPASLVSEVWIRDRPHRDQVLNVPVDVFFDAERPVEEAQIADRRRHVEATDLANAWRPSEYAPGSRSSTRPIAPTCGWPKVSTGNGSRPRPNGTSASSRSPTPWGRSRPRTGP